MSTKGANQLDLVGQYLSGILIPRINAAQTQPTPYEEMASLLEVVTVLDEDGGLKDEWLPRLQQVDRVAQAVQGIDATTTYAKRDRARNYLASRLLPDLKKKVWGLLHGKGYFKMDAFGKGLDLKHLRAAAESGKDDEDEEPGDDDYGPQ